MERSLKNFINEDLEVKHLKIGECIFTNSPMVISTVLGSCVSVSFYHRRTGYSGIFHAILPLSSEVKSEFGACRFVDYSIDSMVQKFRRVDIRLKELEIKLFGGAFTSERSSREDVLRIVDVGAKNVAVAREGLRKHGLRIMNESVQGDRGRKLYFCTNTGEVWVKYLRKMQLLDQKRFQASCYNCESSRAQAS